MASISETAARHAADLLDGIAAHPFWKGIDREQIAEVLSALRSAENIEVRLVADEPPEIGLPGDEMIFNNLGGYDQEREHAREIFSDGEPLIISNTKIGRSSSTYSFVGVKGEFNSVMFDFAEPDVIKQEWMTNRDKRLTEMTRAETYYTPIRGRAEERT